MMLDWNDYRKQLAAGVREFGQLSPDTLKGYMGLSGAGQKSDLLGDKVRELIALAVAVTLRCDGCITVHTEAAIKRGATKEEIAEALARISHTGRRIVAPNQRKFFCEKDFAMIRGAPRCRQSVAWSGLILEGWKAGLWKRPLMPGW